MKLNTSKLTVRSLEHAAKLFINVTNGNTEKAVKTSPVFIALRDEHSTFVPLVGRDQYSRMSEEMNSKSKDLVTIIGGIKKYSTGVLSLHNGAEKGRAAQAVLTAIAKGGKLYNQKTGELDSRTDTVITELSKAEMSDNIALLDLTDTVASLVAENKTYADLTVKRLDLESEISKTESASTARTRLESAMKDYLSLVNAMRKVAGWADIYADISTVVDTINRSIREGKDIEEINGTAQ